MKKKALKNNMFKRNNGITLITLVITIVVLTILAGVIIASLTSGDKNIVSRSKESREDLEKSQEIDILESILIEMESRQFENSEEKLDYIENSLKLEGITDPVVDDEYVIIKNRTHYYTDILPEFSVI